MSQKNLKQSFSSKRNANDKNQQQKQQQQNKKQQQQQQKTKKKPHKILMNINIGNGK